MRRYLNFIILYDRSLLNFGQMYFHLDIFTRWFIVHYQVYYVLTKTILIFIFKTQVLYIIVM